MKNKFIICYLLLLSVFNSCDKNDTATFSIENGTARMVELTFFRYGGTQSEGPFTKNGMGTIIEREAVSFRELTPVDAFMTDSIVVIFENTRIESHSGNKPEGRSLLFTADYEKIGDENYRYVITEADFENAVPCDGPCK